MSHFGKFNSSLLVITLLSTSSVLAANTCPSLEFITASTFWRGDGEGMESLKCSEKNFLNGDKTYATMQSQLKSGQAQQALSALNQARSASHCDDYHLCKPDLELCVRPAQQAPFKNLMESIGKQIAMQQEKNSRVSDAIQTYNNYCLYDESAKAYSKHTQATPLEINLHQQAVDFAKSHHYKDLQSELQQRAANNIKNLIAQDNKTFTASLFTSDFLSQALLWVPFGGNEKTRAEILILAEKHGDTLIARDGCVPIEPAIAYFDVANKPNKIKTAKSRALKFGEQFEKQGAYPAAITCYQLADADAKANALDKKAEAQHTKQTAERQKNEQGRQEKFTKGTDDLEAELGL